MERISLMQRKECRARTLQYPGSPLYQFSFYEIKEWIRKNSKFIDFDLSVEDATYDTEAPIFNEKGQDLRTIYADPDDANEKLDEILERIDNIEFVSAHDWADGIVVQWHDSGPEHYYCKVFIPNNLSKSNCPIISVHLDR